ncbi:L,D-transpeptidase family protein [Streptomyces sp. TLI_146]|uniref:L,D-transpeptidase family protein n=1 Tax=Streptomyces sp. TLI_146 TaxID=1938858 RepID=UPI000C706B5C|nr:L,D-transpeptidase family protein [Streptomyces sp. TLI_146]PKV87314.1 L,D-transpeptidase-like protein [Streptomyces sp. TLI_146]
MTERRPHTPQTPRTPHIPLPKRLTLHLAALATCLTLCGAAYPVPPHPGPGPAPGPVAPDPAPDPAPDSPAPVDALVPGEPRAPGQVVYLMDTPDQVLPPLVYEPTAAEEAVEPAAPAAGVERLVEYVPGNEVGVAACSRQAGPYQRQVERWLKLPADGKQSAADCAAIRRFQTDHGIRPNSGFAGPATWGTMRLLAARANPNAAGHCPVRRTRIACVDLDRQIMWVQKQTKVTFGPVAIRSGRPGFATRTGTYPVYWRHKNHWSTIYNAPMPYAQFFSGGQAFHAIYDNIYSTVGSRGCVNLTYSDAKRLWGALAKGDPVHIWGRRPGA